MTNNNLNLLSETAYCYSHIQSFGPLYSDFMTSYEFADTNSTRCEVINKFVGKIFNKFPYMADYQKFNKVLIDYFVAEYSKVNERYDMKNVKDTLELVSSIYNQV